MENGLSNSSKQSLKFPCGHQSETLKKTWPAVHIVSQGYDFRCAISKFAPRIDQLVEGKQKNKSH